MRYIVLRSTVYTDNTFQMIDGKPEFDPPCSEAIAVEVPIAEKHPVHVWMVDIPDLESLNEFIERHERAVITSGSSDYHWLRSEQHYKEALGNPPVLEIYDGYRE